MNRLVPDLTKHLKIIPPSKNPIADFTAIVVMTTKVFCAVTIGAIACGRMGSPDVAAFIVVVGTLVSSFAMIANMQVFSHAVNARVSLLKRIQSLPPGPTREKARDANRHIAMTGGATLLVMFAYLALPLTDGFKRVVGVLP